MKSLIVLSLLAIGCGSGGVTRYECPDDKATITVKSKQLQVLSHDDWHSHFRQQAIIVDTDNNEYRFNVGENLTQYNRLMLNKKYIVYSYGGHLKKVEEAP